jgi:hypothetical protein
LTPNEFGPETSAIGSYMKFSFHPYKERPKRATKKEPHCKKQSEVEG